MAVRVTTERPEVRRVSPLWWVVAAVLSVLLLVGAFFLGQRSTATAPATTEAPVATESPSSPSSESSGDTEGLTPTQGTVTVDGKPIDGLYIGTATVAQGARGSVYGVPYGWDRTLEGAAATALVSNAAWYSLPNLVDETAVKLSSYLYTGEAYRGRLDDDGKKLRAENRKNSGCPTMGG